MITPKTEKTSHYYGGNDRFRRNSSHTREGGVTLSLALAERGYRHRSRLSSSAPECHARGEATPPGLWSERHWHGATSEAIPANGFLSLRLSARALSRAHRPQRPRGSPPPSRSRTDKRRAFH